MPRQMRIECRRAVASSPLRKAYESIRPCLKEAIDKVKQEMSSKKVIPEHDGEDDVKEKGDKVEIETVVAQKKEKQKERERAAGKSTRQLQLEFRQTKRQQIQRKDTLVQKEVMGARKRPLAGQRVYLQIYRDDTNISTKYDQIIQALGGIAVRNLTHRTTIFVTNLSGSAKQNKARQHPIPPAIVNILWLDQTWRCQEMVPTERFLVVEQPSDSQHQGLKGRGREVVDKLGSERVKGWIGVMAGLAVSML